MVDDLIDIADELARREPGRPRQASLRRAVSSAYYGLFHALAGLCADELIGWSQPWEVFTPVYRSLDHASAKKLFQQARDGRLLGPEVAAIGRVFILLQEQRHTADYNPEPLAFGRAGVLELVAQSREAIRALRALPRERRLKLAVHLVAKPR